MRRGTTPTITFECDADLSAYQRVVLTFRAGCGCESVDVEKGRITFVEGGKALSLGQATFAGGNQCIAFGNSAYVNANNSVAFGHTHLVNKQFCLAAGQGHDFTNAPNGSAAVGVASQIGSDTLFAVGNGTFNSNGNITRSNAFEVLQDGIVLKSPNGTRWKIAVDDSGNLTTTAI